jgi:PAS domain S-box-containing protein
MPSPKMTFEGLLEAVPDALVGVDKSGKIRVVNHQTEWMFGYQRDELIGAPVDMLVPESLRTLHRAHQERYFASPTARPIGTNLKLSGRRADGTEFPVDISLSFDDRGDDMLVVAAVRDMTDRERADKERDRLIRLSAVVEFSGEAIISSTLDSIITSWNPAAERLYGYSGEEIVGEHGGSLIPAGRLDELKAIVDEVRAGHTVENLETVRIRMDGSVFPVSLTVSPIYDADGVIIGSSTIARDATSQRAAFEAAQLMAAVIEFSGEAIITSTLEGVITSWNPAAERLYGYSSEEIVGKSIQPVTPKDRPDEITFILTRIKAGEQIDHFETVRIRKDGTPFPVSITLSPIRDTDGAVAGVSVISRDVTKQRQALESAQRLAAIVEQSDDAIMSRTLDDIVTTWNPAAERLFGYSRDEVIGKSAGIFIPEGYENEIPAILAKIRAGQPVVRIETDRVRKDGTVIPISATFSPIHSADGTIVGASTIARDVTAQREAAELSRSMIEASLDSMVSISPDGMITDANLATVRLTGVPRDQLIGTSFSGYFTDPEKAEAIYQKVFEEGFITDYPLTLRHRDGRETYTEVVYNASVFRDTRGDVIGVFAAARDVTELKQAAGYARSLLEAALDPMVTISAEGEITDTNEATAKLTGVPRDELIGTSFSSYFTDPEKAEAIYQKVFEKGFITDYPLTVRRHNGHETRTEVLYNASVYRDTARNVLGVFASARDVTKQIQAQREIAHQQAMELDRLAELERFQRLTVGRELKMIELKKEIEYLRKLGSAGGGESAEQR